jgi:hypothetical protein
MSEPSRAPIEISGRVHAREHPKGGVERQRGSADPELALSEWFDHDLVAAMQASFIQRGHGNRDLVLGGDPRHTFTIAVKAWDPLGGRRAVSS